MVKKAPAFKLLNHKSENKKKLVSNSKPVIHWKPRITIDVVSFPQTISTESLSTEIASLLKYVRKPLLAD